MVQLSTVKVSADQGGTGQVGTSKVGAVQVGSPKRGVLKAGMPQVCTSKVGIAQDGTGQIVIAQLGIAQVSVAKVNDRAAFACAVHQVCFQQELHNFVLTACVQPAQRRKCPRPHYSLHLLVA